MLQRRRAALSAAGEPDQLPAAPARKEKKGPMPKNPPAHGLSARDLAQLAGRMLEALPRPTHPRSLGLGLQGGGAFGAYTWGVLDRLLEVGDHKLTVLTGASAGALNAAALASGFAAGGADGARSALTALWDDIVSTARLEAPGAAATMAVNQFVGLFSPAGAPRLSMDSFKAMIARRIDVGALEDGPIDIWVSATRVKDFKPRLFRRGQITVDALAASCCLPTVHQAVRIEGDDFWDGGFTANPPLAPLFSARRRLVVAITAPRGGEAQATKSEARRVLSPKHFAASLGADLARLGRRSPEILDAAEHLPRFKEAAVPTTRLVERLFAAGRDDADAWSSGARAAAE